jgi:hypothetical protein
MAAHVRDRGTAAPGADARPVTMSVIVKQPDLTGKFYVTAASAGKTHPGDRLVEAVRRLYPGAEVEVTLAAFCPACGRPSLIGNGRIEPHQIPGSQPWCRASAALLNTFEFEEVSQ